MFKYLVLFGLLASGCSEYDLARGNGNSGDPDTDDPTGNTGGDQPDIKIEPSTVTFGYLLVDCPGDPQTVTVSNVGEEDLLVDGARLSGTGSDAFSLQGSPIDLAPGESFELTLNFTPALLMDYEIDIIVDSNDPDEPEASADVIGHGSEEALYEEIFKQPEIEAIDVLWVVDNSGSMSPIVSHLGDRFASFLTSFSAMGIDYQIGVTSTDMDDPTHSGRLLGTDKVISPTDSDPVGTFVANTDLGDSGSGSERGSEAAYAALTDPLLSGANSGLIRPDANLAIVVLSDEDDSSNEGSWSSWKSNFVSWVEGLKSDPSRTSFSGVIGDPDSGLFGCTGSGFPPVTAIAGKKYEELINGTGGTWQSICDEDFDQMLAYLGYGISGLQFDFELAKTPTSVFEIHVYVDGVEVPRSMTSGWYYFPASNSIHFHQSVVPGPNSEIYVVYPIESDCN